MSTIGRMIKKNVWLAVILFLGAVSMVLTVSGVFDRQTLTQRAADPGSLPTVDVVLDPDTGSTDATTGLWVKVRLRNTSAQTIALGSAQIVLEFDSVFTVNQSSVLCDGKFTSSLINMVDTHNKITIACSVPGGGYNILVSPNGTANYGDSIQLGSFRLKSKVIGQNYQGTVKVISADIPKPEGYVNLAKSLGTGIYNRGITGPSLTPTLPQAAPTQPYCFNVAGLPECTAGMYSIVMSAACEACPTSHPVRCKSNTSYGNIVSCTARPVVASTPTPTPTTVSGDPCLQYTTSAACSGSPASMNCIWYSVNIGNGAPCNKCLRLGTTQLNALCPAVPTATATPRPTGGVQPTATLTPIPCSGVCRPVTPANPTCGSWGGSGLKGYCSDPAAICCTIPGQPTSTTAPLACPKGNQGDLNCDGAINCADWNLMKTVLGLPTSTYMSGILPAGLKHHPNLSIIGETDLINVFDVEILRRNLSAVCN